MTQEEIRGLELILGLGGILGLIQPRAFFALMAVAPPLINETIYFSLNDFKQNIFDKLSQAIRDTISKSPEYCALNIKIGSSPQNDEEYFELSEIDDGIPF